MTTSSTSELVRPLKLTEAVFANVDKILITHFTRLGCTYVAASNGLEGLEQYKASDKTISHVFMGKAPNLRPAPLYFCTLRLSHHKD